MFRRQLSRMAMGGFAALLSTIVLNPSAAWAEESFTPVPPTGAGYLRLESTAFPLIFPALKSGESYSWQIRARAGNGDGAKAWVSLDVSGMASTLQKLTISIRQCSSPFAGDSGKNVGLECPGGAESTRGIVPTLRLDQVKTDMNWVLEPIPLDGSTYLAVTLGAPGGLDIRPSDYVNIGIGVSATGVPGTPSDGSLPTTGAGAIWLILPAAAGVLFGTGLTAVSSRRRARITVDHERTTPAGEPS